MKDPILQLRQLSVGYKGPHKKLQVVAGAIDLSLYAGELVCILGPNGAGKSTLLRTLAAMQSPLAGEVLLDGVSVHSLSKPELARKLSVVLTERVSAGLLTSYELVALGRSPYTGWSGTLNDEDHVIIEESIRAVDAAALAQRFVTELSDGERQKIMLARALAQQPRLMILDEITAFLDLPRRVDIMRILRHLAHDRNRAILLSTHDLELALGTADRVWLLPKGGQLTAGAPEDLVLQGHFASAFASEGVRFDDESGSFTPRRTFHSAIGLSGDRAMVRWTRRALERKGYQVIESSEHSHALPVVSVGNNLWELSRDGRVQRQKSIAELLSALANPRTPDRD